MKASSSMVIQLPVELQTKITNLQEQVNEYKKALEKVDPGSALGKKFTRELATAENQMESLAAKSKQTFRSSSQVDKFADQIERAGTSIRKIGVQLDGLKFSDLKLDAQQTEQFEKLTSDVNTAKEALSKFYQTQLSGMRTSSSANNDFFKSTGIGSGDSVEKVIEKIDKALTKLRENADLTGVKLQEALAQKEKVETQITEKQQKWQTFVDAVAGNSSTFFRSNGKFVTGKNKSGKQALLREMYDNGFSQEDINSIRKMTAEKIQEFFKGIKEAGTKAVVSADLLDARMKAQANVEKAQQANTDAQTRLQTGEQVKSQVDTMVSSQQVEALTQSINTAVQALQSFQNGAVGAAKGAEDVQKAQENLQKGCGEAADGVRQVSAAMAQLEQRQQALSNIQMAVSHWFGFNQIVNIVKSSIKSMITEIRGLDEVITQIAVVTDMTQKDLWAQMDTYSALAQKYGTTIKGVYEVSQLFYQQGGQILDFFLIFCYNTSRWGTIK